MQLKRIEWMHTLRSVDTEINKCPQTTPTIDPLPWDPQPEDETETGH